MDGEQKHRVDWDKIRRLEIELYGEIVSPELLRAQIIKPAETNPYKPVVEYVKPYNEPIYPFPAFQSKPIYTKPQPLPVYTPSISQTALNNPTYYQCSNNGSHYHRVSDNIMVNPFTGEVLPVQWCKGVGK